MIDDNIKSKARELALKLAQSETVLHKGKIDKVIGMTVEATGCSASYGEICKIYTKDESSILAEVVGFRDERTILMPYDDMYQIAPGCLVEPTGNVLYVPVSEDMRGRVLDGLGRPIDGLGEIKEMDRYPINGTPSNPLLRPRIKDRISMGIKAIDGMLTVGKGQRMGIFAGSGVGKSTLMGMIARNVKADINVIALVGERGREVREFIEKDLQKAGLEKSIVVAATSDQPAMVRLKCAQTATAIAEYFKDRGKNVFLMMDSLTRFAMAQREIGLAVGEPPIARGYTPSIYSMLPKLLERAGNFETGSITGLYTVLVEGDDVNEPIADTVRGIIDGHIVLSRNLAAKNHYPAIDILGSISRLMNDIAEQKHIQAAGLVRKMLAVYEQNRDLITIGAYKAGTNKELDTAIEYIDRINAFLCQRTSEDFSFDQTLSELYKIFGN